MTADTSDFSVPAVLKPFVALGFSYSPESTSGEEIRGTCIFCGKRNKLYINTLTGLWSCKGGSCLREGNLSKFIEEWWLNATEVGDDAAAWHFLEENRGISIAVMKAAGVVYDDTTEQFAIPIRDSRNTFRNVKMYATGGKTIGLPTIPAEPFISFTSNITSSTQTVWVCEGEWDAVAMTDIISKAGLSDTTIAVGIPGAGIFKSDWLELFRGKDVILAYDNDAAGRKGALRASKALSKVVRGNVRTYKWEVDDDSGQDVRDLYVANANYGELYSKVCNYDGTAQETNNKVSSVSALALSSATSENNASRGVHRQLSPLPLTKPPFQKITDAYKKWLFMTEDMENAVRLCYAVVTSQKLPGDPLWLYVVSPPGGGKTEVLNSLGGCECCHLESSLTAHSLVSGFRMSGGEDPSLIPRLHGKTFVLKDMTEVLSKQKPDRDAIYSTLRGAYDGKVEMLFGNGVFRQYDCRFSMLAGVTPVIFAETDSSMGERFLTFHIQKGVGFDVREAAMAAMNNSGQESPMREELSIAARSYLDWDLSPESVPPILNENYKSQLYSLAMIVAMLRGSVRRDFKEERILFRPQHEVPTRLVKQFKRLTEALAMLEDTIEINSRVYGIVARVATDTCIGFNLEVTQLIAGTESLSALQVAESSKLPLTTARYALEALCWMGVLDYYKEGHLMSDGRGAPVLRYRLTKEFRYHWETAMLYTEEFAPKLTLGAIPSGTRRRL